MYKLGKGKALFDSRTITLRSILKSEEEIPILPELYCPEISRIVPDIYGNDKWGNCVKVGQAYHTLSMEKVEQGQWVDIKTEDVLREYWKCQHSCVFNRKPDNGLVLLNSLNQWRKDGWSVDGYFYRIQAFARIDYIKELKFALFHLGGVQAGFQLPNIVKRYISRDSTWEISDEDSQEYQGGSWGGHLIYLFGYTPYHLLGISWGKFVSISYDFFLRYSDEAYAVADQRNVWMPESIINSDKLLYQLKCIEERRII